MPDPTPARGKPAEPLKMTPLQQKVREIKAEHPDWNNSAIARIAGCSVAAVWKILNPEGARTLARRSNAKRGAAKRAWADQHRALCVGCGRSRGEGSAKADGSARTQTDYCRDCAHKRAIHALREMVRLRREYDMTNVEIAERLGMTPKSVATQLKDLRSLGLDVPHAPYNRPKAGRRRHTPRSVSSATAATVYEAFPELREVDAQQPEAA